ncbi:MAG: hypothetical protein MUO78_08310 [candidate division Zixibacteria bacterium]|nr:hypothetical protein [candidate division Zixibacteria bacterium]
MKRKTILVFILSLILFKSSSATELKSNISTYFNSYQTRDLYTEEKTSYFRAYQSFRFDLNQIGTKNLYFHTYFRSTTDFLHKNSTDPSTKIYNAYLDWKDIKKILDLRLGRQYLYAGVGNGTMDGLRVDVKPIEKIKLTGYVGFQLPRERSTDIDTWEKSHIFGGELSATYLKDTRLAVNYVQKVRDRWIEEHLIGLSASHYHKKFDFFSQFYYNLVYRKAQNFTLRGTSSELFGKLYLALEYQYRRPNIYSNSIFSVFKQEPYSIYRFTGTYQPIKNFRFTSKYDFTKYKKDNSSRVRFGVEYSFIALGLNFRRGYGGESNGVYGKIIYTFNRNFVFSVSTDYGRYKLDEEQESKDESFAISSRVEWEPLKNLQLAMEMQDVRNKIKNYDLRLQGKASYKFGLSFKGKKRE